jgi:Bacterial SH3 domain
VAVAIRSGRRQVTHRPLWVRPHEPESNAALPLIVVVLLTVGVTAWLLSSQMLEVSLPRNVIPKLPPSVPSRPTEGAAPMSRIALSATTEPASAEPLTPVAEDAPPAPAAEDAQPAPESHELAVGGRAQVANTDNLGVVLYAAPRDGARQPAGLLEGTTVTVLERSGEEWARVQSDSKKAGWVRAQFLVPAE